MAKIVDLLFQANTKEVKDAQAALKDLADQIPGLSGLIDGLGGSFDMMNTIVTKLPMSIGGVTAAIGGMVAALGLLGIKLANDYNDQIDALGDLGDKFGYNASQILLMKQAAEDAGGSLESVMNSAGKVSRAMGAAGDETKGTGAAFKTMGVNITDAAGQLKSIDDVTGELINRWQTGSKTAEEFAAMQKTLGKDFQQQIPIIQEVNAAKERAAELDAAGIYVSQEAAQAASDNEKANRELKALMTSFGSDLVAIVIPAFTSMSEWMVKSYENGGLVAGAFKLVEGATKVMTAAIIVAQEIFIGFDATVTIAAKTVGALAAALANPTKVGSIWDAYKEDIKGVADAAATEIKKLDKHWDELGKKTRQAAGDGNTDTGGGESAAASSSKSAAAAREARAAERAADKEREEAARKQKKEDDEAAAKKRDNAKLMADGTRRIVEEAERYTAEIEKSHNAQTMSTREIEKQAAIKRVELRTQQMIDEAKERELDVNQATTKALAQQSVEIAKINKAYQQQEADRGSYFGGMKAGWQEIDEQMTNYNEQAKQFTVDTFGKMSDSLTDFVLTGKANFKDLASSILSDLANMIIKQQIFNALKAAGGGMFAEGGVVQGGVQMFAEGGVVNSPTYFPMAGNNVGLVGEAGYPEAIVPMKNGRSIPVDIRGSGGGGNVYNITVNVQGNGKQSGAEQGEQISQAVMDKMKLVARGEIANAQRPGNALSRG